MIEERRPGKLNKQKSKKVLRILLTCFTVFSFSPQLANRGH